MVITTANSEDITIIKDLAYEIWPNAYGNILSQAQITYMLDLFYNEVTLLNQMQNGQNFILIQEENLFLGFAAYEFNCKNSDKTKLHKLYVLPQTQGKGIGKKLIDYIEFEASKANQKGVFLNVNKYNKAKEFYNHLGYKIMDEEVIDIGNNYVMDDYIMEKKW